MTLAEDAQDLLVRLNAPIALLRHNRLVMEAAHELISRTLRLMNESCPQTSCVIDCDLVEALVHYHDAGKITVPEELTQPGRRHEAAGWEILTQNGVSGRLAHICYSHSMWWWRGHDHVEELFVALADTLWKGKRNPTLEECFVSEMIARPATTRMDLWKKFDEAFEAIADGGDDRLRRSRMP